MARLAMVCGHAANRIGIDGRPRRRATLNRERLAVRIGRRRVGRGTRRPAEATREPQVVPARVETIGRSAQGRPIRAVRVGDPRAPHPGAGGGGDPRHRAGGAGGDPPPAPRPSAARAWRCGWSTSSIPTAPRPAHGRTPAEWTSTATSPSAGAPSARPFDTYHSGAGAAVGARVPGGRGPDRKRSRPRVTLYYHQMLRLVDRGGGDRALERLYSRRSGLPLRGHPASTRRRHAVADTDTFPRDTAFVVELPAGRLSAAGGQRATPARCWRWPGRSRRRACASSRSRSAPSASARCAPTPAATTGSTTSGCAGRA